MPTPATDLEGTQSATRSGIDDADHGVTKNALGQLSRLGPFNGEHGWAPINAEPKGAEHAFDIMAFAQRQRWVLGPGEVPLTD